MKKKFYTLAFVMCFTMLLSLSAFASSPVIDKADLLDAAQEESLASLALAMKEQIGAEVVIITTNEVIPGSRDIWIEDLYYGEGFGDDGAVLHIDMYGREAWAQVFGAVDDNMQVADRDELITVSLAELKLGDYYGAGEIFIESLPAALDGTIRFGLSGFEIMVTFITAVVVFCSIFFGVRFVYNSEGKEKPYPFAERGSLLMKESTDHFLRDYITQVHRPKSSGGGSGGGISHSSGRSSSSSGGRF